jgi:hypothetical protein
MVEHKKSTSDRKEASGLISSMLNAHSQATVSFGVNNRDIIGRETSDQTIREIRQTTAASRLHGCVGCEMSVGSYAKQHQLI